VDVDSKKFAGQIAEIIFSKKGYDVKILELKNISSIADYFVVCSADSDRQVKAIADEVEDKLRENGIKCIHREGYESLTWIILDYFDVMIHVFKAEARTFYNLEKLWGDAPVIEVKDEEPEVKPKKTVKKTTVKKTTVKKTTTSSPRTKKGK
jgi:ribosome-associated protein